MEELMLSKILCSLALLVVLSLVLHLCNTLLTKPRRIRSKLQKQGIGGPVPSILLGNIPEMKRLQSMVAKEPSPQQISHDYLPTLFPFFKHWTNQYGRIFTFSLGSMQLLYVADPSMVKEINLCTTLDLGKPAYLQKDRGPLFGKGIIATNKEVWVHQRKTIAPEFYMTKVKDMLNLMVEAGSILVKTWERKIESNGGLADIKIDMDIRNFTSYIISRILFGRDCIKGIGLFPKLRDLIIALQTPSILNGIPGFRFIPSQKNREIWRLESEIHSIIRSIVKEQTQARTKDLLQTLMVAATKGELGSSTPDQFVVDNCKDVCLASFEATAISAMWSLMLLALHPEWQARVRTEVLEVCGNNFPDSNMLGKMKLMEMFIQEVLRLYPSVAFISRQALKDLKLGDIWLPKGVCIWIWIAALNQDTEIWGSDAKYFNPERFAKGTSKACRFAQAYIPFGAGSRTCPGQNLGIMELKVMLFMILSNFSFSLSPTYCHSPLLSLLLEPKYGVNLLVRKL